MDVADGAGRESIVEELAVQPVDLTGGEFRNAVAAEGGEDVITEESFVGGGGLAGHTSGLHVDPVINVSGEVQLALVNTQSAFQELGHTNGQLPLGVVLRSLDRP